MNELRRYEKQFRTEFSWIAFSILCLMAIWVGVSIGLDLLVNSYFPAIKSNYFYLWFSNDIALYGLGFPVFLLIIRAIPARAPEKRRMTAGTWFIIFSISVTAMLVGNFISSMLMSVFSLLAGYLPTNNIDVIVSNIDPLTLFVLVCIIAPLGEEFIFRKCLCDRYRRYGERTATIISALIFAAFHGNLFQFFYAFLLGLIFAHVYLKTGKLRYTVLLHAAVNFIGGVIPSLFDTTAILEMPDTTNTEAMLEFFANNLVPVIGTLVHTVLMYGIAAAGLILLLCFKNRITFEQGEIRIPSFRVGSVMFGNCGAILLTIAFTGLIILSLL